MPQLALMWAVLFACLIGPSQLPGPSSLDEFARKSDTVMLAIVESKAWVVRPEKMVGGQTTLPGGNIEVGIPNPRDYVVGSLFNVRIEQILKKHNRVRTRRTLRIFVPGFMASAHESATLVLTGKYLLFLERLESEGGTFSGTRVYRPDTKTAREETFDPKSSFIVVESGNGAVQITEKNLKIIDRVKVSLNP
jgi:hypothetical protein